MNEFNVKQNMHGCKMLQEIQQQQYDVRWWYFAV